MVRMCALIVHAIDCEHMQVKEKHSIADLMVMVQVLGMYSTVGTI